jgi:hypothetical protein
MSRRWSPGRRRPTHEGWGVRPRRARPRTRPARRCRRPRAGEHGPGPGARGRPQHACAEQPALGRRAGRAAHGGRAVASDPARSDPLTRRTRDGPGRPGACRPGRSPGGRSSRRGSGRRRRRARRCGRRPSARPVRPLGHDDVTFLDEPSQLDVRATARSVVLDRVLERGPSAQFEVRGQVSTPPSMRRRY